MKKYQLVMPRHGSNDAGAKAPEDVRQTLLRLGFEENSWPLPEVRSLFGLRLLGRLVLLVKMLGRSFFFSRNSLVVYQIPCPYLNGKLSVWGLRFLRQVKHVRFVAIIHDVEELRLRRQSTCEILFWENVISFTDILVVHNAEMKKWFAEHKSLPEERLVDMEIFDYLINGKKVEYKAEGKKYEISVAGNLMPSKSAYVYSLSKVKGVLWHLYGPNYDGRRQSPDVVYEGCVHPDDLPNVLHKGWGLVWDGDSLQNCSGVCGEYLRYNNPHKLSLYLASGIPVIVWKKSAVAPFVERFKVGIAVESLHEIQKAIDCLTTEDWFEILKNVVSMSVRLQEGYYLEKAVSICMTRIYGTV